MVIIGQEGKTIINFKRINFLNIEEADNNKFNILINYGDDIEGIIATYENEERAKEVLEEIVESYLGVNIIEEQDRQLNFDENTQIRIRPHCYRMPKK